MMYIDPVGFTVDHIVEIANQWHDKKMTGEEAMKAVFLALKTLEKIEKGAEPAFTE